MASKAKPQAAPEPPPMSPHEFVALKLMERFGLSRQLVEEVVSEDQAHADITEFFSSEGQSTLYFFLQEPEDADPLGFFSSESSEIYVKLYYTKGRDLSLTGTCLFFVRPNKSEIKNLSDRGELENATCIGEFGCGPIKSYASVLQHVFAPGLKDWKEWGQCTPEEVQMYCANLEKFTNYVVSTVDSLEAGVDLKRPQLEGKSQSSAKEVAEDHSTMESFKSVMRSWELYINSILNETQPLEVDNNSGPQSEIDYWRFRLSKLTSITMQLRTRPFRVVITLCNLSQAGERGRWKKVEELLQNAVTEAQDTNKFLSTLERLVQPMYVGTPVDIRESLPGLMNTLKMILTVAKYYGDKARMRNLLHKMANEMIICCKSHITKLSKRLWEQKPGELSERLRECVELRDAFKQIYLHEQAQLKLQPQVKQLDFPTQTIFSRFDLFSLRCQKLKFMFSTIDQLNKVFKLGDSIEGILDIQRNFEDVVSMLKSKSYDLLDFEKIQYDRDYLEFEAHVVEIDSSLENLIVASFNQVDSTEAALALMLKFKKVMLRPSLQHQLDGHYLTIFKNFGKDIEGVMVQYESEKDDVSGGRDIPPVAARILWSRQLLRKLETPMLQFSNIGILTKESEEIKHIIRHYNRCARKLIEYETMWHLAWKKKVRAASDGLQATLLIRHPLNSKIFVNFDPDVFSLIDEARAIQRLGLDIPPHAHEILTQRASIKNAYFGLQFMLREEGRIKSQVRAFLKPLLKPVLNHIRNIIQPGVTTMTWMSVNIPPYLSKIHLALSRLEALLHSCYDLVEERIDKNIQKISNSSLVALPSTTFNLSRFVLFQEEYASKKSRELDHANHEVERAVQDLIQIVTTFPMDTELSEEDSIQQKFDSVRIKYYFEREVYKAILAGTRKALTQLKRKLAMTDKDTPLFTANVELVIPNVRINPSMSDIQQSVNQCVLHILRISKRVYVWGQDRRNPKGKLESYYDQIAQDNRIVGCILLLSGATERQDQNAQIYLSTLDSFREIWMADHYDALLKFKNSKPSLSDFEEKFVNFDEQLARINNIETPVNVGIMALSILPMKNALKSDVSKWKSQYATFLQEAAARDLDHVSTFVRETQLKLEKEISYLIEVTEAMGLIREVRDRDASFERDVIGPLQEKYKLLAKYDVRVSKEEIDLAGGLGDTWLKVVHTEKKVTEELQRRQETFHRELIDSVKSFVHDVTHFRSSFESNGPLVPGLDAMEAADRLKMFQAEFRTLAVKWTTYSKSEYLFGLPVTPYPELEQSKIELELLDKLYTLFLHAIQTIETFNGTQWASVSSLIDGMRDQMSTFETQIKKLPKELRQWEAHGRLTQMVSNFIQKIPLVELLCKPAIRRRHWEALMEITTSKIDVRRMSLGELLNIPLLENFEEVEDLCTSSIKEAEIETKLGVITEDWLSCVIAFVPFKNRGNVILKGQTLSELMEHLEESQLSLTSMSTSRYSLPFAAEVQIWIARLSQISELLEHWGSVQSMWMYMEAVFGSGDIARQMPQEAKRFQSIDKGLMAIVAKATEVRMLVNMCCNNDLLKTQLPKLSEQLELCQRSLTGYLEQKRSVFPRFYFVSDSVLLEMLSQSSQPHAIRPHLQSVFDSLTDVTFDRASTKANVIIEMHSGEGETVALRDVMEAKGNVEDWLINLVDAMKYTIRLISQDARDEIDLTEFKLLDLISKFPAQISLLGIQFIWTRDVTEALYRTRFDKNAYTTMSKKCGGLLAELVALTVQPLENLMRSNVETLITIQVHNRDVFDEIAKKKVKDVSDFEWLKQLRTYWVGETETCQIRVADVDFEYCNEYLGCKERLVITPLTDRCYISLSQALGMFLGGAPAGPAGTGKTETVKDLGRSTGKYVVVFNCSDQMDYRALGRIYKGLAMSGCWGCFDEFNRIHLEVLSVAAQQVQCVLYACRERRATFTFTDGAVVPLDRKAAFFITMNPGYAGRQELPENLKILFRGVTMMVPDRQIIMKVKLAACGYSSIDILSKKFNVLYYLCEQQLSKQAHYDFGLRNILSVLRSAGATKRANPQDTEDVLLMRTLRDMNMSKFVAEDVPLFLSLLTDLFPKIVVQKGSFPEIDAAIRHQATELNLQLHDPWLEKIIQLYESSLVRHGIMVIGPSGGGKSMCTDVLAKALTQCGQKHAVIRINPKAITAPQMFGRLDIVSNDWTDGIFSVIWRKANKTKNIHTWILLDGPVDAIWIENLNTVLDDNKLLTLANGDRIPMLPTVKLLFEAENLNNASPATVSRAGQIYVSSVVLGWEPVVASWLAKRRPAEVEILQNLFDNLFGPALEYSSKRLKHTMNMPVLSPVSTLCVLLDISLAEGQSVGLIKMIFAFGTWWSVGAVCSAEERAKLDFVLRDILVKNEISPPEKEEGKNVFDFFVDVNLAQWVPWADRVKISEAGTKDLHSILIPTGHSVCHQSLLSQISSSGKPTLFIGDSGVTKTATIEQFLSKINSGTHCTINVPFSNETTPNIFQRTIESNLDKRQGRNYGPAGGKIGYVFIDDISLPQINEWGDQITNEIVRQVLGEGGVYSLDKPGDWVAFVDLLFIGSMLSPGGGNNDIPNRLKRLFVCLSIPMPSRADISIIFSYIVSLKFADPFPAKVSTAAAALVEGTLNVWATLRAKLLSTPANFHYMFNMRELSRIFRGMTLAESSCIFEERTLCYLWMHECEREMGDKLTSEEDLNFFKKAIGDEATRIFSPAVMNTVKRTQHVLFGTFLKERDEDLPPIYEFETHIEDVRARIYKQQQTHNENTRGSKLELVMFDDAIRHLARIARILSIPRASLLAVGVGGSGKQSLTRLAAYLTESTLFRMTQLKNYTISSLFEDFKSVYKLSGSQGKNVCFLITDTDIKDEAFLEYINQFLASGQVANVCAKDELDAMIVDARQAARQLMPHIVDSHELLKKFFFDRIRNNVHLVLAFSPVGSLLSSRARKFPALVNCVTVDWLLPWPKQALQDVAVKFVGGLGEGWGTSTVIDLMSFTHDNAVANSDLYFKKFRKNVYNTPKSYLSFLNSFETVYKNQHEKVKLLKDQIDIGLKKLAEAEDDIAVMKEALLTKELVLASAQRTTNELLKEITTSTMKAETKREEVQRVKDALTVQFTAISKDKQIIEVDLAAAQPALIEAEQALNSINSKDIQGLKALRNPPIVIKLVFDAVRILKLYKMPKCEMVEEKGVKMLKDFYAQSLLMMAEPSFLESLLRFDKDAINDETVEILAPYTDMDMFTVEAAARSSGMAAGLCQWVRSMVTYQQIAKVVKPKMDSLKLAQQQAEYANKKLQQATQELDVVQGQLDRMQERFDEAMAEKNRLQEELASTKRRMDAANHLIQGLDGEKTRWKNQQFQFVDEINRLPGDCAIACGFLSYLGPFNKEFREKLTSELVAQCGSLRIPFTAQINIVNFLVDDSETGDWSLEGLPTDDLSKQNGLLVTRAHRYPLLIDPQGQGLFWVKNREAGNNISVAEFGDEKLRHTLEVCLSEGRPMLIQNIEQPDALLDPVLNKDQVKTNRGFKIQLADSEVDFDPAFKLFLTSRQPNPHFSPEFSAKVTVIDFTVTQSGLEDQLLGRVVLREKPELQEQRTQLLKEVNNCRVKISQLEKDLLTRLSSSEGNLLDDTTLIDVLAQTNKTSKEVSDRLRSANETEERIVSACEEYRPIAARASVLYFLISQMSAVNGMYTASLNTFTQLFEKSIAQSEKHAIVSKRIYAVLSTLTYNTHIYVSRGLFEKHKIIFIVLLAIRIEMRAGTLKQMHFDCFVKGGASLDAASVPKKPRELSFITDAAWINIYYLSEYSGIAHFKGLPENICRLEQLWRVWCEQESPEQNPMPDGLDKEGGLDSFEKLLVIRALREDRTLLAAYDYIVNILGQRFVEPVQINFTNIATEATATTPILCILSPGSDPTDVILALAKKRKKDLKTVSMGQGQEIIARKLLEAAIPSGAWVLLGNAHLGLKFLAEVENLILSLEEPNEEFRLWITTESHPSIPIGLLHLSLKVTNEAPVGIRAGMRRTYTSWINQDFLDAVPRSGVWRSLLFVTCFMHSVVQERRKFGPIGWAIPYEFNQSDLSASVQFIQNHITEADARKSKEVAWSTIRYMVSEIQYGGKITDDWDRRLMNTYADKYFRQASLEPNHAVAPNYIVPYTLDINVFRSAIDNFHALDPPSVFGLDSNADLVFRLANVEEAFNAILETQPKSGSTTGSATREEIVAGVAKDCLEKLPEMIETHDISNFLKRSGPTNPLNICLRQEVEVVQRLLLDVRKTLQNLLLAIEGKIVLNDALIQALDALFDARVPPGWVKKSWSSPTLGVWLTALSLRYEQWHKWIFIGKPSTFWLPGFANPQGFLTALRQDVARHHAGWALDDVVLYSEVSKYTEDTLKEPPAEGVMIRGLFLQGASWSLKENRLIDPPPKSLFNPLPLLFVTGILATDPLPSAQSQQPKSKDTPQVPATTYECPCYKTKARTGLNYIFAAQIRTTDPSSKWVLRGTALLCSKD